MSYIAAMALINAMTISKESLSLSSSPSRSAARSARRAFTLVELLVVLAIMALLASLMTAAFSSISNASSVTSSAYMISAALERGRAYAMAHNTYVWVGFYEENADANPPTTVKPPYQGAGRVLIGMVASADGTDVVDTDMNSGTGQMPPADLVQIEKIIQLQNLDLAQMSTMKTKAVAGTPLDTAEATSPGYNLSNNGSSASDATQYPFVLGSYTFYKTIRFSPTGEGYINDGSTLYSLTEIDLQPTHGDTVDTKTPNVAAIRFSGIGGNVHVYRN